MSNNPIQTVTIPLDDVIYLALGSERRGTRSIPPTTAVILDNIFKDSVNFKIQFTWWNGESLQEPKLWSYHEWLSSNNYYKSMRANEERERAAWNIMNANVKIITIHLMHMLSLDSDNAKNSALKLLHNPNPSKLKSLGITNLVTREEDIPKAIELSKIDTRQEAGTLIYGKYTIKD